MPTTSATKKSMTPAKVKSELRRILREAEKAKLMISIDSQYLDRYSIIEVTKLN